MQQAISVDLGLRLPLKCAGKAPGAGGAAFIGRIPHHFSASLPPWRAIAPRFRQARYGFGSARKVFREQAHPRC